MKLDLGNGTPYDLFHRFSMNDAFTYADTREGHRDKDKRMRIRAAALRHFPTSRPDLSSSEWAFRIRVQKPGNRAFDIENVAKLFIDAFCSKMIEKDNSRNRNLALYEDDSITFVTGMLVTGSRTDGYPFTVVEIFHRQATRRQ